MAATDTRQQGTRRRRTNAGQLHQAPAGVPSYLRHILDQPDLLDTSTEYLIYNLGPEPEFEQEALQRLSRLTPAQLQCLTALLQYWQQSERWGEYCAEDLARAIRFLQAQGRDA